MLGFVIAQPNKPNIIIISVGFPYLKRHAPQPTIFPSREVLGREADFI